VKSRVYANKLKTIPELKVEIQRVNGETELQLCGNVIENFVTRTYPIQIAFSHQQ
jgi:hypothetical protein